jgi:hypothetical protein
VAPVDQRGDAGVDLGQRADQVAEIIVLGLVERRQIAVDVLEIIRPHPLRGNAAQPGLPRVHVGVDQAGHHNLVGGVDHLVRRGAEVAADRLDAATAEQKLAVPEIPELAVERHQPAATNQHALHCDLPGCGLAL